jgi:lactate dehydrogenase-like 2-hydroxyacid dehydrogenase
MLAVARHTVAADAFTRKGSYKYWEPGLFVGQQLSGKTVGIVGTGEIGSLFAAMCHNGLRMRVLYTDLASRPELEKSLGASKVSLEQLLAKSDVVSLHVPLLASTHHLIGAEQLEQMKETAILINTARGPVVDEKALTHALKEHQIYGAAIDVFEEEPKLATGLKELENVLLTPHIASATEAARLGMAEVVARNVKAALAGERPPHLVNTVQN